MTTERRTLRSTSAGLKEEVAPSVKSQYPDGPTEGSHLPVIFTDSTTTSIPNFNESVRVIQPGSKLPGLKSSELSLLRQKQAKLQANTSSTLKSLPQGDQHLKALNATLIFAQYEAGTAVCVNGSGWILTCSHCFGDTEKEYQNSSKKAWLLYYTGQAVYVECRFWDSKRDLALLKIVAIETDEGTTGQAPLFASIPVASAAPRYNLPILCIGQPGRDDLESTSERKTKYNLVEVSEGNFKGMVKGVDPQDNSEIGSLKHDAWTYWGHSGAPLIGWQNGLLIGLHSSWDEETCMRHGVPAIAIRAFLEECLPDLGI